MSASEGISITLHRYVSLSLFICTHLFPLAFRLPCSSTAPQFLIEVVNYWKNTLTPFQAIRRCERGVCVRERAENIRPKSIIFRSLSLLSLLSRPLAVTVETVEGMGGGHRCAGAKLNSVTQTLLICFCLIKAAQSLGRTEKYLLSTIKRSIIWNVFYVAFNGSRCKNTDVEYIIYLRKWWY